MRERGGRGEREREEGGWERELSFFITCVPGLAGGVAERVLLACFVCIHSSHCHDHLETKCQQKQVQPSCSSATSLHTVVVKQGINTCVTSGKRCMIA